MADTPKSLTELHCRKASNGGWIIHTDPDLNRAGGQYAFTSAADMLAALPEMIGDHLTMARKDLRERIARDKSVLLAQDADVASLLGIDTPNVKHTFNNATSPGVCMEGAPAEERAGVAIAARRGPLTDIQKDAIEKYFDGLPYEYDRVSKKRI